MSKRQIAQALAGHKQREIAKRAERLVVSGYPSSHNPYLPHYKQEDCFVGCIPMLMNLSPGNLPVRGGAK